MYTKEVETILKVLQTESNGKAISSINVVLKIMEIYAKEEDVEDLSVVSYTKDYNKAKLETITNSLIKLESSGFQGPGLKEILDKAEELSKTYQQQSIPIVGSFHLLLACFTLSPEIEQIFKDNKGGDINKLVSCFTANRDIFESINKFIEGLLGSGSSSWTSNSTGDVSSSDEILESIGFPLAHGEESKTNTPMLDKYAKDLTKEELDPVFGREQELEQLLEILGCKKKNNAILVGEPGVGKTSVVELLAQRIKTKNVPKNFMGKRIYSLDLNSLVAGTKYRGQYEERLQGIIEEVVSSKDIIVFIDEIHNLVGNGSSDSSGDAANILKPYLAKGKFQCIGSTTFREYRKFIEKDGALKRRFQNVIIEEPDKEETKVILRNIKGTYEKHHNVVFPKEVIDSIVELSGRYISDRNFPDKAIDILDLAGSLARLRDSDVETKKYLELETTLEKIREIKSKAIENQDFEEATQQKSQENEVMREMNVKDKKLTVTLEDVYSSIGKRSGVPIDNIGSSDLDKLRKLNSILTKEVVGQEKAVKEIVMSLQKNSLSIRDPKRPIASLLFVGPTGSGKTYLCKQLAKEFFGSQDALIKFDMSEYGEKHNITKLTGAAASYVGYDDEPGFEQIRKKPYSVVLFDEIEKAAPEVYQIFLSILDEGYITLANGVRIDFKNTIIIFTGNIGTKELSLFGRGVGYASSTDTVPDEAKKDSIVRKAIEKTFAPEFINRLSKITIFSSLGKSELLKISDLEINKLKERLRTNKIKLQVTKALKEYMVSQCDLKYGARDLQRNITKYIEESICEKLLEENVDTSKKTFILDYNNDKLNITLK